MREEKPLYLKVADGVEELIRSGTLRAGDRIPSVRRLSRQQKVSIPTILQAYMLLEDRRIIEARPKSGFYVRPRLADAMREPITRARTPAAKTLAGFDPMMAILRDIGTGGLVPLGGAIPSAELLPGARLARIAAKVAREMTDECVNYDPAPGSARFRAEISRRSMDWGCYLGADEFLVTNGATEALYLALCAVTKPGDSVIVESPVYYGLLAILSRLRLKAVAVASSAAGGISIEGVRAAIRKHRIAAIALIPNFSNPLGSLMPEDARGELVREAGRHRIPLVEDDIYGDLQHEGSRPRCLKALDVSDNVILCGSFSKTVAPGFRAGYLAAGRHREKVLRLKMAVSFAGASLPALTIAEFLRTGGYDHHLRRIRRTYREQVQKMREAVAVAFPKGTKISNPLGGFVLWVELPGRVDALRLYSEARAAGISIAPGQLFSPAGEFRNYIRLSCGFPWSPRIEQAIETLGQLAGRQ